jgi:SAM-dependent methyltransferase
VTQVHWALESSPDRDTLASRVRRLVGAGYIPRRREWERKRKALLDLRGPATRVLEIGAGGRRLTPGTVTLDLLPLANVDVVADAASLPVRDESFDCLWLECVLEHCPDPRRVAGEAWRVMAPGGVLYMHVPWILFYHAFPSDYWRFSPDAIRTLVPPEAEIETGPVYGPASAMVSLAAELLPRVFSASDSLWPYAVMRTLLLLFLFPLKYLDFFVARTPAGLRLAGSIYAVARKPGIPGG